MKLKDYFQLPNAHGKREFAAITGINYTSMTQYLLGVRPIPPIEWCIPVEKATGGLVPCEELRPDIDWSYLRDRAA